LPLKVKLMTKKKFDLYKENFDLFIHFLLSIKEYDKVDGIEIMSKDFFKQELLKKIFDMYYKTFAHKEKFLFIEGKPTTPGFEMFLCMYLFYKCYFNLKFRGVIVCKLSEAKEYISSFIELSKLLSKIIPLSIKYKETQRYIECSNGSTILFLSSTTYNFFENRRKFDLIAFNSCKITNEEKFLFFLNKCNTENRFGDKIIVNFERSSIDVLAKSIDLTQDNSLIINL